MKINVGYIYHLTGDIEINLYKYISFCKANGIGPYENTDINLESIKEFVLEKHNLIKEANDGESEWIDIVN